MMKQEHPLFRLIEEIKKIPGIGLKTARRIAFYIISLEQEEVDNLTDSIKKAKQSLFYCSICNNLTHVDPCQFCEDKNRNDDLLCIVEEPFNIDSIEKSEIYSGRYHVLLGALSPLKGIGPDELGLEKIIKRIKTNKFKEVIIATNPTADGEATASYLTKILMNYDVRLTRLAMGLPVGSDIDYADQMTIKKSLEGRTEIKKI